jgi:diguanylate cyclase (GGDEF)-like protein
MFTGFLPLLDRWIGLPHETERERVFLIEKLAAFIPRMPWIYAILLVNLGGLLVSLSWNVPYLLSAGVAMFVVLSARLTHWWRMPQQELTYQRALRELRRLFLLGNALSVCYCVWILSIYRQSGNDARNNIIMFGSLAAMGCAYALSPLASAAKVPLYALALPLALVMVASGQTVHVAMGMTLVTLIFVTLKLIRAQNLTFTRLINARFDIELEKQRAEAAERRAVIERSLARKLADTDVLTGLANRRALLAEVDRRSHEREGAIAVALLDLDGFKAINDTFGHTTGDELLIAVARRLCDLTRDEGALVARLGGDEFAILFHHSSHADAEHIIATAIEQLGEPYTHCERSLMVSACAGIAFRDRAEIDPAHIIRMADIALFSAKRKGRGVVEIFSRSLEMDAKRRAEIELALRAPGVENDIELAFQPIVDLATLQVCSFEALARWRHSELGWISPSEFIPITEQISVVERISEALLTRAAGEAVRWPESIRLSFNLSAVQLCSDKSAQRILRLVAEAGLAPSRLQLEVTETALLGDFDAARRNLAQLGEAGVRLVLDDFGAGYASISYLREMKFDAIKLDGSLVSAATADRGGLQLLKGVLDLCRAVGLPCVAEHVETEQQVATLRLLGCQYGQGYWLARPMPAEDAQRVAQAGTVAADPVQAVRDRAAKAG